MRESRRFGIRFAVLMVLLAALFSLWRILQIDVLPSVLFWALPFVLFSFGGSAYLAGSLVISWVKPMDKGWFRKLFAAFLVSFLMYIFVSVPIGIIGALLSSFDFVGFFRVLPLQIFIALGFGLQLMIVVTPLCFLLFWGRVIR